MRLLLCTPLLGVEVIEKKHEQSPRGPRVGRHSIHSVPKCHEGYLRGGRISTILCKDAR